VRRFQLVALDQALSSATNFATVLLAGVYLGGADFGAYALAGSLFGLTLAAARMSSSERLATPTRDHAQFVLAPITVVAVAVAAIVGSGLLLVVTERSVVIQWIIAGPLIVLNDRMRYAALIRRPVVAVAADATWFVVVVAAWSSIELGLLDGEIGLIVATAGGPAAGLFVLAAEGWRSVTAWTAVDLRAARSEVPYIADAWLQAAAVFISLAVVASTASLTVAGGARGVMLVFQPFVSLSYAGRLLIIGSSDERRVRAWPTIMLVASLAYSILIGGVLILAHAADSTPSIWDFGRITFVLVACGQVARAFHQGVVDVLRRTDPRGLLPARLVFAVVIVALTAPLVRRWELEGFALTFGVSYTIGAAVMWWRKRRDSASTAPVSDTVAGDGSH